MTSTEGVAPAPGGATRRRARPGKVLAPYLLSLPAGLWLLALFLVPLVVMLSLSLQTCNFGTGACVMTWHWGEFWSQLSLYHTQFLTSIYFAGAATIILDGVRSGAWRILVGQDAVSLDGFVRAKPDDAYDYAQLASLAAQNAGGRA